MPKGWFGDQQAHARAAKKRWGATPRVEVWVYKPDGVWVARFDAHSTLEKNQARAEAFMRQLDSRYYYKAELRVNGEII